MAKVTVTLPDEAGVIAELQTKVDELEGGALHLEAESFQDALVIGEFRGSYPTVPTFPGVEIAELTAGDDDPMYVTIPVAQDNTKSGNGRFFSAAFVDEIARQMADKRVTGIQGHITMEQRGSHFPTPAAYWIGAQRVGNTLWGKAYVPPGDTREMIRRLKAAGSKLSTSIYGVGDMVWDKDNSVWSVSPKNYNLEQIDFAPAERAGVKSLGRVPVVTSEMSENDNPEQRDDSEDVMDRLQVISEMSKDDIRYLPPSVVEAIQGQIERPELGVISEIEAMLKPVNGDGKPVQTVIAELVSQNADLNAKLAEVERANIAGQIEGKVREMVMKDASETPAVQAVRAMVAEMVTLQNPQTTNEIEALVGKVLERDHVKTMLESVVVSEMGPNQSRPPERLDSETGEGAGAGTSMLGPKPEAAAS